MSKDNLTPDDYFRVEVSDLEGQIVAIEREMIAGRAITPILEGKIRKAIAHLCGFIGDREPSVAIDSEQMPFVGIEPNNEPLSHQAIFCAVNHFAREIIRMTDAVTVECNPKID